MALDLALNDLSHLDRIRRVLAENDLNGQFAALDMAEVHVSENALHLLTDVLARHLAAAGRTPSSATRVCVLTDPVLIRRRNADLKALVLERIGARHRAVRVVMDDGHPILHADEAILEAAAAACAGADAVVSVGGGTITDVAKIAAERAGVPVHVVIQTAASVDGFTDNFAVVLQNGVKTTLPSRWPDAVLTDTQVIAGAPPYLNASGFGELMSMYSAPGDWFLAARMGMDRRFAPVLLDMLALCGEGVEDWSAGVGRAEPEACARLATALAMRGIVTGVGGTTASLSGMEHLVSHMLDMANGELRAPTGLHGAQVGVGSVIRAAAWEEFRDRVAREGLPVARLFRDPAGAEAALRDAFAWLDPTGRIGGECGSRYRAKLDLWHAARPQVEAAFANWDALTAEHDRLCFGAGAIARHLHRAGAPMRFADLDPAPSAARIHWVTGNCQFMRERFTIADLLTLAGWWTPEDVARVLDRAEAACAAAERGA